MQCSRPERRHKVIYVDGGGSLDFHFCHRLIFSKKSVHSDCSNMQLWVSDV